MTKRIVIVFLLSSFRLLGQNCFEDCWNKYTNSQNQKAYQDSVAHLSMKQMQERDKNIINALIGCNVPDFTVKTIDGKTLSMAGLKGKIVVLNFWFSGCKPCIAEIPALNRLVEDYKNADVEFIAFSLNDTTTIQKFLESKEFKYHIVSSEYDMEQRFCILLGYPTNIVIDKKGIVRKIVYGSPLDERANRAAYDSIQPVINKYLKE